MAMFTSQFTKLVKLDSQQFEIWQECCLEFQKFTEYFAARSVVKYLAFAQ